MPARIFDRPSDLLASVGQDLGVSDWLVLDQHRIDTFADATDDHQWIHVDPVRAAHGPFGATIAHGFLTLSLTPHFLHEVFAVHGVGHAVNYGLAKVRFPSPAPVGSRLRASVRLSQCEPLKGGVQGIVEVRIEGEGAPKPMCVAEVILRYYDAR